MEDWLRVLWPLAVSLTACAIIRRYQVSRALLSPTPICAILAVVHFLVPAILQVFGARGVFVYPANEAYADHAVLYVALSLAAVHVGERLGAATATSASPRHGAQNWGTDRAVACALVLTIAGWLARIHIVGAGGYFQIERATQGNLEGPFYAAIRFLEQLPFDGLIIVAVLYWRKSWLGSRAISGRWLLLGACLELLYWAPSGRKEPIVLVFLLLAAVRYLRTKTLPRPGHVLPVAVAMIALFPVMFVYRAAMEAAGEQGDPGTVISATLQVAADGAEGPQKPAHEILLGRLSLLESVSACIRLVEEDRRELLWGRSYLDSLLTFIPRVFWPGKPNLHYGNDFGHEAGILGYRDDRTSISVTFIGESFLNFSWAGLIGMALYGGIFSALHHLARGTVNKETWILVYCSALPSLLYAGGTFAMHIGGLIKEVVILYLLGLAMTGHSRRASPVRLEVA